MSWTKVRTWVGSQPVDTLLYGLAAILVGGFAVVVLATLAGLHEEWIERARTIAAFAACSAAAALSCAMTMLLRRSGRRSTAALASAVICALPLGASLVRWRDLRYNPFWGLAVFGGVVGGSVVVGWAVGVLVARLMIRSGRWEVMGPVQKEP